MPVFQKIKNFALDTLFPIYCLSCRQAGAFLCEECFQKIRFLSFQVCPRCEKLITEKGRLCQRCHSSFPSLDGLIAATRYKENGISRLVHLYKYNFVENLHLPLGRILVKAILKNDLPLPDLIVPVPLHSRRLRWRGFNQAELLAEHVAANLAPGFPIPVLHDLLVRQKYTPPQMKIGKYADRRKNVRDAFQIKTGASLKNKRVLLIDDICTTGATLFACAQVLKQNGAKKVMAAVIARQEFGAK